MSSQNFIQNNNINIKYLDIKDSEKSDLKSKIDKLNYLILQPNFSITQREIPKKSKKSTKKPESNPLASSSEITTRSNDQTLTRKDSTLDNSKDMVDTHEKIEIVDVTRKKVNQKYNEFKINISNLIENLVANYNLFLNQENLVNQIKVNNFSEVQMHFETIDNIYFLQQLISRTEKSYQDSLNKLEQDFNSLCLNLFRHFTITFSDPKCLANLASNLILLSDKFNDNFKKLKEKQPQYQTMSNFIPVEKQTEVIGNSSDKKIPTNISSRTKEMSKDSELKLLQNQINQVMKQYNDSKDRATQDRLLNELMEVSQENNKINQKSRMRTLDFDLHKLKTNSLKRVRELFEMEQSKVNTNHIGSQSQEQENERRKEVMNEIRISKNKMQQLEQARMHEWNKDFELSDSDEERDLHEMKELVRNQNTRDHF